MPNYTERINHLQKKVEREMAWALQQENKKTSDELSGNGKSRN